MASIEFRITASDGTVTTRTAAVSDQDVGRLIAWGMETFADQNDSDGRPIPKTPDWVVKRWIEDVVGTAFIAIAEHERTKAAAAAQAAIRIIPVEIR